MKGDPPAVFPKKRSVLLLAAVVLLVCCCLVVPAVAADGTGTQDDPIVVPEYGYIIQSGNLLGINATWLDTVASGGDPVWLVLKIPDRINGQTVTQIARSPSGSFNRNCLADSSKNLAAGSRYQISSVDVSDAVHLKTFGSQAFMYRSEISGVIELPNSVEVLDKSVFNGCSGLTGVYLPTGLKQIGTTSSGSVFKGCTGLQFIRVTGQDASVGNFTLPDTLTTIGSQSFQTCFAESVSTPVIIPASVTWIGSQAFYNTGLSYLPITTIVFEGSISSGIDGGAFKSFDFAYGLGERITILRDNESYKNYVPDKYGTNSYYDSITYEMDLVFDGVSGAEGRQKKLYNLPVNSVYNEGTGLWEVDTTYTLPDLPHNPSSSYEGYEYSWILGGKPLTRESLVVAKEPLNVLIATPDLYPENPTTNLVLDGTAYPEHSRSSYSLSMDDVPHTVGFIAIHPLTEPDPDGNYVYFRYKWTDIVPPGKEGPRMAESGFGEIQEQNEITIRNAGDARVKDAGAYYLVEIYGYYHIKGVSPDELFYKSSHTAIADNSEATVKTAYTLYINVNEPVMPVVIAPVSLTIYANEKFPLPLYSGIPENAVIKVNGQTYQVDEPPFEIAYYNTTTNTQILKPDTPGIYNATIQPVQEGVQLAQITIDDNPVTFRNGTLTVRQITDASETIPVAQQTLGGDRISVSVPEDTTYYLNGNTSLPEVSAEKIHLLHDEILAGGEETLKRIALEYFDDSSKYEMKYFDLIDTGNGHTWVSSSKGVTITWPYPEGTDENTEFTLLHYLDLHREYFTDADLNSDTETVTVSKTGSGVQFSIQESGFSPFALIWSDQKPVPTPPSGGDSGDGNMDNAFRVLFNDGATTLFVVTDLSYGDKLTKPEDPVKDGYTFAGWHKDAACTQAWDFADGIAGDMTLYAKWTPVQTVTPTVTPTATASVTPTVTAEPTGLPTTTPTVQPTGEDDGGKPAGSVLPLIGGILILILAVLLLLFLLLRHTVTFLIPTGGEITEHRIKVWHGRYIDPADLPELLRTAAWYRDPARRERWDFDEDRVTKSIELYLG